jgi:type II secretory pathway predicted ATPase ExeA
MQRKHTWFGKQAFGKHAGSQTGIECQSHRGALDYLRSTLASNDGIAVLQGPMRSGKNSIIGQFRTRLSRDTACAVIDGARLKPEALLSSVMREFGYVAELTSLDEQLKLVNVFAVQQLRTCQAPILIIENIDQMYPASLRVLTILASFAVRNQYAVRMVLTSQRDPGPILSAENMVNIANRARQIFNIQPLSATESMKHLHGRLEACGIRNPDSVFPIDICDWLHEQSKGWPGQLDACAMEALERASSFPLHAADTYEQDYGVGASAASTVMADTEIVKQPSLPRLIITPHGKPPINYVFNNKKVLVGRSDLADICIEDRFVSNAHVLLLLYSDSLVLLDLNSSNGTYVNSVRLRTTVLASNDIISLGHYRIKVENAPASKNDVVDGVDLSDTSEMRTLEDMRQQKFGSAQWSVDDQQNNA